MPLAAYRHGMSDRRYDAVICDIDGCLGPESNAPLDVAALEKIAEHNLSAIERGDAPVLTLCSGRPQPFAEAMCRFLSNTTLPCIAENGVWLFDPRTNRYLRDPAISAEHLEAVHAASVWIDRELGPKNIVIQPGKTASISLWHPDTAFLKSHMPRLREVFAREGWPFRVSDTIAWINCDLEHVSKATGIARFLRETGLEPSRLAGVGDSPSDLVMLDHVAFFACPANSHAQVKARANYVSPEAEVRGVLDILGRLAGPGA